ncbi:MAG: hypothetical protein OHK0037_13500 [Elainellaceae cyanobacterium]
MLWLPLLAVFCWLAWAGWNEYQKLEAYRQWAAEFERAKYDILAALGQRGDELVWGKPTRQGPVALQTVKLSDVRAIALQLDGHPAALDAPPEQGRNPAIALELSSGTATIPFTDLAIAVEWGRFLQRHQQALLGDRDMSSS